MVLSQVIEQEMVSLTLILKDFFFGFHFQVTRPMLVSINKETSVHLLHNYN